MPSAKSVIGECLQNGPVLQLATTTNDGPWICTVYFVAMGRSVYWLSLPTRHHSQHVQHDPRVAIAIALKLDQPVVGLQAIGKAQVVTDSREVEQVMKLYIAKYGTGQQFYRRFVAGTHKHWLYTCGLEAIKVFDER